MNYNTRKKTISLLLVAALALSSALKAEEMHPFLLPEEVTLESLQELKDKNGKKRKLSIKNRLTY